MSRKPFLVLSAGFLIAAFTPAAHAQMPGGSPIPGMEKQCVLNHPFSATINIGVAGVAADPKTAPVAIQMPGVIMRDSDGRQRVQMTFQPPNGKESTELTLIFDPPAGKLHMLIPELKQALTQQMEQVHCAPAPAEPDFSELTKQGATITSLGTKNEGELRENGYKIAMNIPIPADKSGKTVPPQKVEMELWMDMVQSIPVSMRVNSGTEMAMNMTVTGVKLAEPAASEFKLPAGYTETEMPVMKTITTPSAVPQQ